MASLFRHRHWLLSGTNSRYPKHLGRCFGIVRWPCCGGDRPKLRIPSELYELGLVLFVYTIGLSCGPTFFRNFQSGIPNNCFIAIVIICVATAIILIAKLINLSPATAAGFFAGCMTNTPALQR